MIGYIYCFGDEEAAIRDEQNLDALDAMGDPELECSECEGRFYDSDFAEGGHCPDHQEAGCKGILMAIADEFIDTTPQPEHTQAAIDMCTGPVVKQALEERKLELTGTVLSTDDEALECSECQQLFDDRKQGDRCPDSEEYNCDGILIYIDKGERYEPNIDV